MNIISHTMLPRRLLEGCSTQTVAGAALCQAPFEVQVHTLDAGASAEPETHPEAQVVLALAGSGKLLMDGGPLRFSAPCTLLIPARSSFQFVNNAATPMQLVSVFQPTLDQDASQP